MAERLSGIGSRREVLLDARGSALRLTWHPDESVTVISLWREDRCIGTFRARPSDMARLASQLSGFLAEAVDGDLPGLSDTA